MWDKDQRRHRHARWPDISKIKETSHYMQIIKTRTRGTCSHRSRLLVRNERAKRGPAAASRLWLSKLLPFSDMCINTVFIQIDAHALIDSHPFTIKHLVHENRWNWWFFLSKMHRLEVRFWAYHYVPISCFAYAQFATIRMNSVWQTLFSQHLLMGLWQSTGQCCSSLGHVLQHRPYMYICVTVHWDWCISDRLQCS